MPSTLNATMPMTAPAGRGTRKARGGAEGPSNRCSFCSHQRVKASPTTSEQAATMTPFQAKSPDSATTPMVMVTSWTIMTTAPRRRSRAASASRGTTIDPMRGAGHTAGVGSAAHDLRTRRARNRAIPVAPATANTTKPAVRPSPTSREGGVGNT